MSRFGTQDVLLEAPVGSRFSADDELVPDNIYRGNPDMADVTKTAKEVYKNSVELGIPLETAQSAHPQLVAGKEQGKLSELFQRYIRDPITEKTGLFPYVTDYGDPRGPDKGIFTQMMDNKHVPFFAAGRIGADYASGLGFMAPDVIASEFDRYILDSPTPVTSMSGLVKKITGNVDLGEAEKATQQTGQFLQFVGGLKTARKLIGPLMNRLPVRQALKIILAGGLELGSVSAAQEVADKITKGEGIDWGRIHKSAGWGTIFGGVESIVGKIIQFKDVKDVLRAEPRLKSIPNSLLMKVTEAGQARASGMTKKAWMKVYGDDMREFTRHLERIAATPLVEAKGVAKAKPVEAAAKPTKAPVKPVEPTRPVRAEIVQKAKEAAKIKPQVAGGKKVIPLTEKEVHDLMVESLDENQLLMYLQDEVQAQTTGDPEAALRAFDTETSVMFERGYVFDETNNQWVRVSAAKRAEIDKQVEERLKKKTPVTKPPPQEPRLGPKEAGATTIIPDVITEVSETSKRLGVNIGGVVKGAKEIYSRNVLRYTTHLKSLGIRGQQVAKDFDDITQRAQKRINNSGLDSKAILKGVNKENREKIAKIINGKLKNQPKWLTDRAKKLRKVLDELITEANAVGMTRTVGGKKLKITGTGKAFPQVTNALGDKILKDAGKHGISSPAVLAVAQEAVELGFADSVEGYVANLIHYRNDQLRNISGYLERTRIELPTRFLEWDPDRILDNLFQKNWLLIEGTRQWGPDKKGLSFPKLKVQTEGIRDAHGPEEAQKLEQFQKAAFGKEFQSSESAREISGLIRGYQFFMKIAESPLTITRNILDRFTKGRAIAPLSVQLKTLVQYPPFINTWLKHSRQLEEEVIRTGAIFSNTAIGEGYQPGHLLTKLAAKPFASSELGNQVYIALLKKNAIDYNLQLLKTNPKIAKIFDKRIGNLLSPLETIGRSPTQARARLRELGNDELIDKLESVDDISPDLLDAVLHRTVRDHAFPVVLSTKRLWWDNKPFARVATQFKTWSVEQVGHIWNDVIKDSVKNRDPSKMIAWLVTMAVMGEIYNILRDFILGKDESLFATLSDKERRNVQDVSITILKDMLDGGAVGIMADIIYGLPNLVGGPTFQTAKNIGEATVKVIWNPKQAKDAFAQIGEKEAPALKQAHGILNKIDAKYEQKNITQDYYKVRSEAFKWSHDKRYPKASDKAKRALVQSIVGWVKNVPQERTLSYELAIRQILVGDTEDASEHLFFLMTTAGDNQEELLSIQKGIDSAMSNASPLGRVAEKDISEFYRGLSNEAKRKANTTQLRWDSNVGEAIRLANDKYRKWQREQR